MSIIEVNLSTGERTERQPSAQEQAWIDEVSSDWNSDAKWNARVDADISAIERREMAPRFSREATLIGIIKDHMRDYGVDAGTAIADLTTVGGPWFSHGFNRLKGLDDQIKALRAMRK